MSEKKKLLEEDEAGGDYGTDETGFSPPPDEPWKQPPSPPPRNAVLEFFSTHRASIPGYGMLKMLKGSSLYSLYVLFILLMVYLTNQLDRYTLPIVTSSSGYDLQYGDVYCIKNKQIPASAFDKYHINTTSVCGKKDYDYVDDFGLNETLNVK
jgi:hypothetical protein